MQGGRCKEIEVKKYDVMKLNPPNYLNDTLINFYLRYFFLINWRIIENLLIGEELRNQVYIFNTYLMEKLCPNDKIGMIPAGDTQRITELFSKTYD